jgi:hypothetical protein
MPTENNQTILFPLVQLKMYILKSHLTAAQTGFFFKELILTDLYFTTKNKKPYSETTIPEKFQQWEM